MTNTPAPRGAPAHLRDFPIMVRIADVPIVGPEAAVLFAVLCALVQSHEETPLATARVSDRSGLPESGIRRAARRLSGAGWIEVRHLNVETPLWTISRGDA